MINLLIVFTLCLGISAFLAGIEMAFVTTQVTKLKGREDSEDKAVQKVLQLKEKPDVVLTSLLISNNIVNINATAIFTYMVNHYLGISNEWLVTAAMVPVLLIIGELIPKDYCRVDGQKILLRNVFSLDLISKVFEIPSKFILKSLNAIYKIFGMAEAKNIFVSEMEFRLLIEESAQTGVLKHHEKEIIETILDFERVKVKTVMTPLEKVAKINLTGVIQDIKDIARQTHSKMALVYEEDPSIIVGMIYVFDILFEKNERTKITPYLRAPIFISENLTVEKAFLMLQQKRQSFAVVIDQFNDVKGVVPIEKLLSVGVK